MISEVTEEINDLLSKSRPTVTSFFDDFLEVVSERFAVYSRGFHTRISLSISDIHGTADDFRSKLLELFIRMENESKAPWERGMTQHCTLAACRLIVQLYLFPMIGRTLSSLA